MKTDLTEIIFLLDRSGSMGGFESDTIGGFNAFLEKQRQLPGIQLLQLYYSMINMKYYGTV
jgi:hypothetical protein